MCTVYSNSRSFLKLQDCRIVASHKQVLSLSFTWPVLSVALSGAQLEVGGFTVATGLGAISAIQTSGAKAARAATFTKA